MSDAGDDFEDELEIEEWNIGSLKTIGQECKTLSLRNNAGKPIRGETLERDLHRVAGMEKITSLVVLSSSRLEDLSFIKALPELENLQLYGLRLRSLAGVERLERGRFIEVDTGRNRQRDISGIAAVPVTRLSLRWANPGDVEAIAGSSTIRNLALNDCPPLSLERWRGVPIESMSLLGGQLQELVHTRVLGKLRQIILGRCSKLEHFAGDNGNVTWMVIEACNRLDFKTIGTFGGVESLNVVKIKSEVPMSAFASLRELRHLSLRQCNVEYDIQSLRKSAPKLEKLLITGLRKAPLVALSAANPDVLISDGVSSYRNGTLVKSDA